MRMKKVVRNFLKPKSVALVGASETPGKVGYILMKKFENFKGKVFPVNIKREFIFGKKCFSSADKIPGRVDLAVIATPAESVEKIIEQCGVKKIRSVIIITSGFAEVKNDSLQKKIIEKARKYKMRILGPNCFGVANPDLNLDTTFSNFSPREGSTAFISQSGALGSYLADLPKVGFSGYVSLGNMADLSFVDFIEYFNRDKKTKKIILYVEKLKNGREFIDVCRKSRKEIVAVKVGKTREGSEAAVSHTASLATDYNVYKGAFSQAGIKISKSLYNAINPNSEFYFPKLRGVKNKTFIVTNAGGAGAIISDMAEENGYDLIEKPLDLLGTATAKDYEKALSKKFVKKYDVVMVVLTPQSMTNPDEVAKVVVNYAKKNKSKKVIGFFLGEKSVKNAWEILRKGNVEVEGRV